jgi:hypothetical protein
MFQFQAGLTAWTTYLSAYSGAVVVLRPTDASRRQRAAASPPYFAVTETRETELVGEEERTKP